MSAESILYFRSGKREISDPHGRITGADELMMRNTRYSSYSSLFRPHCFHHGSGGICSMPLALFSKPQCFHEFSSLFFQALSTLEIDRVIFRACVTCCDRLRSFGFGACSNYGNISIFRVAARILLP